MRTRSLPNGKYQRICIKDGKTYAGYVEKKGSGKSAHKKKPKSTKFGDLYG